MSWAQWRRLFEARARRTLSPALPPSELSGLQQRELLRSLRIFQIGETGEGRIVHEIRRLQCLDLDDDYRAALALIIAEEGRHARLLGLCVRSLGGEPLRHSWTERLFTWGRRAVGVRAKLVVLFAAEVIGIAFYGALSRGLPPGALRHRLAEIGEDEVAHYEFHLAFFRQYRAQPLKWLLFVAAWWAVALACTAVLVADHRRTLRAFGLRPLAVGRQCWELTAFVLGTELCDKAPTQPEAGANPVVGRFHLV
jgi:hypothetical protein